MVQEEYKASSVLNAYYTTVSSGSCGTPSSTDNASINTNLFGGKEQLDISDPKFSFCIESGNNNDGGFKMITQRPDGTDQMTLNANNAKTGW